MSEQDINSSNQAEREETAEPVLEIREKEQPSEKPPISELQELNDKYLRLYAQFENYRKKVNKDREELIKYGNESLLYELLPALDNLELALKHSSGDMKNGLVKGVEVTLKELQRILEKFGLTRIEAAGKPFDPSIHHAMSQVERNDMDEKMVAEEFRAGYRYRDKVLRPSLVSVSVKPQAPEEKREAVCDPDEEIEIKFAKNTEEEE